MHSGIQEFVRFVAKQFWEFFTNSANVLDVGSGDVNGNNRQFFDMSCTYQGNDVYPGRNVDLIYRTTELPFMKPTFDTIISTECFQHDPEWKDSLRKCIAMLKPGGMFVFTCASTGRPEHGTRKTTPLESYGTRGKLSKFQNYYEVLTLESVASAIDLDSVFTEYRCYYNQKYKDIFFWGIKKGTTINFPIPEFEVPGYVRITLGSSHVEMEPVVVEKPVVVDKPLPVKVQQQPPLTPKRDPFLPPTISATVTTLTTPVLTTMESSNQLSSTQTPTQQIDSDDGWQVPQSKAQKKQQSNQNQQNQKQKQNQQRKK